MARRTNQLTEYELNQVFDTEEPLTFIEALELFLKDCYIRNLREHTLKYYKNELTAFNKLLEEQGFVLRPSDVTTEHIKNNVILYMKEQKGLKTVTINTRLRAVRSFFNFLKEQDHIKNNPMKTVKLLKDRTQKVETFTREQVKALLKQPNLRTFTGLRDYTIMTLLLETGVRVNELINIRIPDIQSDSIRIKHAKNYFERTVPIQNKMKTQLKKWLTIRGITENDFLFITIDGEPISKRTVQETISKYGKMAQIKGVRCSPHTFRHTFARMCVENGANVFELQRILGHTTLDMTKQYVNLFSKEIIENHRKFSPLNSLK